MKLEPYLRMPNGCNSPPGPMAPLDLPMSVSRPVPPAVPAADGVDPHRMSPRQFAEWAYDVYLEGQMLWQDYRLAGFPSELHPSFEMTIGALTGERAEPDRPRDMLLEWERRHAFERRHHGRDSAVAERCARIVALLRWEADGRVSRPPFAPVATR